MDDNEAQLPMLETVRVELKVASARDGWRRAHGVFPEDAWRREPDICLRELREHLTREH